MMRSKIEIERYIQSYQFPVDIASHEWFDVTDDGKKIFTQIFTPAHYENTVLFLHGFFDHTGTHASFIRFLVNHGYRVIAFDLPGHGMSGGERFRVENFEEYQTSFLAVTGKLQERGIHSCQAVGHSTGAAIIAERLLKKTKDSMTFSKACLIAPLLRSNKWWLSKTLTTLLSPFLTKVPRKYPDVSQSGKFIEQLKKDPLEGQVIYLQWVQAMFEWEKLLAENKPVKDHAFIIQGVNDKTVDWSHNMKEYQRLFPYSTRIIVDEGTHHLLHNESLFVYQLVIHYLNN